MKKLILIFPLLLSLGCVTTPDGHKDIDPEKVEALAPIVENLANLGTQALITSEPKAAPFIRAALPVLRALDLGTVDADKMHAALVAASDKVNELKDPRMLALVKPVLGIVNGFLVSSKVKLLGDERGWKILVVALLRGMDEGAKLYISIPSSKDVAYVLL